MQDRRWSLSVEGDEAMGGVSLAGALQSKENRYI